MEFSFWEVAIWRNVPPFNLLYGGTVPPANFLYGGTFRQLISYMAERFYICWCWWIVIILRKWKNDESSSISREKLLRKCVRYHFGVRYFCSSVSVVYSICVRYIIGLSYRSYHEIVFCFFWNMSVMAMYKSFPPPTPQKKSRDEHPSRLISKMLAGT